MKNELLHNFVAKLKENDFKVYTSDNKDDYSYCHIVKDDRIGYIQSSYFGGLDFSTVHKPCSKFGTGFGISSNIYKPTLSDALETFIFAPIWAKGDLTTIKKYKSWDDYLSLPINEILLNKEV